MQHDDDQDQDGNRADLLVDVEADHPFEFLADAAGADKADDRRGANIDLEPQQRVAEESRQHLRHHAIAHPSSQLPPAARIPSTGRMSAFSLTSENSFPECAGGVNGDGEDAGQRADAERPDQDERQYHLRESNASPPATGA